MTTHYKNLRGGSWGCLGNYCRSAPRFDSVPGTRGYDFGFRVISPKESTKEPVLLSERVYYVPRPLVRLRGSSMPEDYSDVRTTYKTNDGIVYRGYYYGFRVIT